MKLGLVLLLLPLLLLSGCSFIFGYWVEAEYELTQCPSTGFEFPERVAAGKGLVVAGESDKYCHGFSFFNVYPVPPNVDYFDVTESRPETMVMFAKFNRGEKCRLQVIVSGRCRFNTPKDACRKETFPVVTEATIKEAIEMAVDGLLYRSGAKKEKMADLRVVGFDDDLEAWCKARSNSALRVRQR